MSRQISNKDMIGWGKKKQNEAIAMAMDGKENRCPRSAKTKAIEKKVWHGAARMGPKPKDKQKRAAPTVAESEKRKRAKHGSPELDNENGHQDDNDGGLNPGFEEVETMSDPAGGFDDGVPNTQESTTTPNVVIYDGGYEGEPQSGCPPRDRPAPLRKRTGKLVLEPSDEEDFGNGGFDDGETIKKSASQDTEYLLDQFDIINQAPVPSQRRRGETRGVESELESGNEDEGFGDGDTDVESDSDEDPPPRNQYKRRQTVQQPDTRAGFRDDNHDSNKRAVSKGRSTTAKQVPSTERGFKKSKTTGSTKKSTMSIAVNYEETRRSTNTNSSSASLDSNNARPAKSKSAPAAKTATKTARQVAREKEIPQWGGFDSASVQEGPTSDRKAQKKQTATERQAWPEDTHITFQPDGKLSLKAQIPSVKAVLRLAITYIQAKLLFKNAFPSPAEKVQFCRDVLYTASKDLEHENMSERLRLDVTYTKALAKLVEGRISGIRGLVKKSCNAHGAAYYGLKKGCGDKAKELLDRKFETDKPYGNGVFQAVLADTIFKGNNSIAYKIRDQFFSSLEEFEDELEIPQPMLAFIATGLHVVVAEWETGTQQSKTFTASTLSAIYRKHLSILNRLAKRKPKAYHKAMHALFTAALHNDDDADSDVEDVIADIDFDAMED